MKITLRDLQNKKACQTAILDYRFNKFENINWSEVKKITVYDQDIFNNLIWLAENFKLNIIARFEDSNNFWKNYIYNNQGLLIRYEDSNNYWKNYIYNEQGLLIRYEDSNNISYKPKKYNYKIEKINRKKI